MDATIKIDAHCARCGVKVTMENLGSIDNHIELESPASGMGKYPWKSYRPTGLRTFLCKTCDPPPLVEPQGFI